MNKYQEIIYYIENESEIAIPIERFFNEDGSNITKKQYGHILLEILVKELKNKFLNKEHKFKIDPSKVIIVDPIYIKENQSEPRRK